MKKAFLTVLFMTLITVVFIASLAWVNESSRSRIAQNDKIFRLQSVLYACNLMPEGVDETLLSPAMTTSDLPWNNEAILHLTRQRIVSVTLPITPVVRDKLKGSMLSLTDSAEVQVLFDEAGAVLGYGFPLRGKGLWGALGAFAVVSADLNTMIGLDFTEQSETPGLGARITESWFKYFFRGLKIDGLHRPDGEGVVMVNRKIQSNLESPTNSVQAITGATQTCNGVVNMVNADLRFYLALLRGNMSILNDQFKGVN